MPSVVRNPSTGEKIYGPLSIMEGGTGATTPEGVRASVGLYATSEKGQPNGPIPLSASKGITSAFIRDTKTIQVSLDGPLTLRPNESAIYYITSFDSYSAYTVSAEKGHAVLGVGYVTYTAPNETGDAGFVINGRPFKVVVQGAAIVAPKIVLPIQGSSQTITKIGHFYTNLSVLCERYATDNTAEPQRATDWEIYVATDVDEADVDAEATELPTSGNWEVVHTSYQGNFLLSYTVAGNIFDRPEALTSTYALRARHHGTTLASQWSKFVFFKVRVNTEENEVPKAALSYTAEFLDNYENSQGSSTRVRDDTGRRSPYISCRLDAIDVTYEQFLKGVEFEISTGILFYPDETISWSTEDVVDHRVGDTYNFTIPMSVPTDTLIFVRCRYESVADVYGPWSSIKQFLASQYMPTVVDEPMRFKTKVSPRLRIEQTSNNYFKLFTKNLETANCYISPTPVAGKFVGDAILGVMTADAAIKSSCSLNDHQFTVWEVRDSEGLLLGSTEIAGDNNAAGRYATTLTFIPYFDSIDSADTTTFTLQARYLSRDRALVIETDPVSFTFKNHWSLL